MTIFSSDSSWDGKAKYCTNCGRELKRYSKPDYTYFDAETGKKMVHVLHALACPQTLRFLGGFGHSAYSLPSSEEVLK